MAKNNGQSVAVSGAPVALPRGMARIGSESNAPWWHLKPYNAFYGTLINIYKRPDERSPTGFSRFYQIELTQYVDPATGEVTDYYVDPKSKSPLVTEVRIGRGKSATFAPAVPGTVINVNYGPKTKDFEPLIKDIMRGAEYKVFAYITGEKFEIKNAQTMWPIVTGAVMTRSPKEDDEPDFEGEEKGEGSQAGAV